MEWRGVGRGHIYIQKTDQISYLKLRTKDSVPGIVVTPYTPRDREVLAECPVCMIRCYDKFGCYVTSDTTMFVLT
jgi:hypothetical protein